MPPIITVVNSTGPSYNTAFDAPHASSDRLDDASTSRPARKRRKVSEEKPAGPDQPPIKPARIRKKGKLVALPEMPLDVLYEVRATYAVKGDMLTTFRYSAACTPLTYYTYLRRLRCSAVCS